MSDLESRVLIANFCRERFPQLTTINNGWLVGYDDHQSREPDKSTRVYMEMGADEVRDFKGHGYWVRHPDIMVFRQGKMRTDSGLDPWRDKVLIIEVDGAIHKRRQAATEERDEFYADHGFTVIALDDEGGLPDGWMTIVDTGVQKLLGRAEMF